ncbi:MAG: hypothetical protein AAB527_03525 [Patescibacteria group bacterium]
MKKLWTAVAFALLGCGVLAVDLAVAAVVESVSLEKDGTRWSSRRGSSELWTVMVGDTAPAEKKAIAWTRNLGPFALNATLWARAPAKVSLWKKVTFRRPANIDEFAEFVYSKEKFYSESYESALPPPFDRLSAEDLAKIDFVISYADGGTKVYLFGVTPEETKTFFLKIQNLSK